jgi:hypothetical protein
MAGAVGPGTGTTLAYANVPEWLTGMGVAALRPLATQPDSTGAVPAQNVR